MANNTYTQDIILDADGKPVLDALALVRNVMGEIQKAVTGIGVTSVNDAKKWQQELALNIKMLKQAQSDLNTLAKERTDRAGGFAAVEKQARDRARIEVKADEEAYNQRKIQAKVYYGEKQRVDRENAALEKQLDKEVADYEIAQDKRKIASAKEVAAARKEATTAAVQNKARGVTDLSDARAIKADSDARLNALRRERETVAAKDAEAARGIASRIEIEKQLQRSIGTTIAALERKAEAQAKADSRFTGTATKLLAPADVSRTAASIGSSGAVAYYKSEQAAAQAALRATIASTTATAEQRVLAQQNLEIANRRVTAAERLVAQEQRLANEEARRAAAGSTDPKKTPLQNILSPQYAVTAFARTALYGAAAGVAYGAFNAVQSGLSQVVQMEDELAKLQAIANATEPQMQQIKAAIYGIGEASRFSVLDLAKISQTLAQAGVSAGDMRDVLKAVTTLATASGSTPDEAVNLVTSALGSFQLQASEAARVADLMTSALNRTKLTVQQTGQAIQYVGATAFEQNISLEQLLATIGAVAQAGIKSGSTIGTGFRQFLVDLANPSEKLTTQLSALKLTAADVDVTTRGLPAVLDTLRKAGFGAGQAYAGLETRAAAFYLVAKNNVDVMDQLQLGFANSGAAAVANERAMSSLSAQWQRFKNILAEGLDESMQHTFDILKDILKAISNKIEENRKVAEDLRQQNANGTAAWYNTDITPYASTALRKSLNVIGNVVNGKDLASGGTLAQRFDPNSGLGEWLDSWGKKAEGASVASEKLATSVATTSEEVDKQTGKISELDKEMARLLVQKESLRGNDVRSAAEIATLTSRFQGLAIYLTNTGNRYDDLTNAVNRYRIAQINLLNLDLTAQSSALTLQTRDAARAGGAAINDIQKNPSLLGALNPAERAALNVLKTKPSNDPQFQKAQGIINDAVRRFSDNDPKNGATNDVLVGKLNAVIQAAGTIALNTAQNNAITTRIADNTAANTAEGRKITSDSNAITAIITKLGSATGDDKTKLANQGLAAVNALQKYISGVIPGKGGANLAFLRNAQSDVNSLKSQIEAVLIPTKKELQEQAKADREQAKREKLVTQADVDSIGTALGLRLGSGTRTPAEQEALFRRGVTRARGVGPRVSDHVGNVARDFLTNGMSDDEAERYATALRARYRAAGINAQVKYENGKGKNNGTGPHIHVGVKKGTTRRTDNTDTLEDKYDVALGQAQIALDEEDLKQKIKAVASATTKETFDSSVEAAKAALDKVNSQLKGQAENELAVNGFVKGDPQYDAKMLQVQQTINQNIEDFNQKIADGIIASVKRQVDAAQTAFDKATEGAQRNVNLAQAQATGLDAFSLRNKVPDYVRSLANDRIAAAQENLARNQFNALPAQINSTRTALQNAQDKVGSLTDPAAVEKANASIAELNKQLVQLVTTREALGAQLGAGGLVPTNFSDGLNQAIQAFRQAHDLNQTFSQGLIQNLGGALDTVNDGLTTMFTSILDGSQTALQAFGTFAQGVMKWMVQLAAKAVATQIFNLLLNVIGGAVGGGHGDAAGGGSALHWGSDIGSGVIQGAFTGGGVDDDGYIRRAGGGIVENGTPAMDSVKTKLARGEWVTQKKAVDSVGTQFMARLNNHGAKALEGLQSIPALDMQSHFESNIYVVPPAQKPTLGPNDVRVILNDDLMNGDSKRLVEHISRSSR